MIERVNQLDCLLAYVTALERLASDEDNCVYLHNMLSVKVDQLQKGRWQVVAAHGQDPESLQICGVGSSVQQALGDAAKWIRAIILAHGDLHSVRIL